MTPDIIEFITDPQLLGISLSEAQETLLRATYGLPLSPAQLEVYRACTGRETPPQGPFGEVTVVAGARAGKDSRVAAPIVLYEALFGEHSRHLGRGERAVIPLVAQDQRATRVAFGYIRDYLQGSELLASLVEEVLSLEITLTNRVHILCFPCTQRSLRGWSIPAAVLDELAFFRLEGAADSDAEIQASIRRGMVAFPAPRLVKISTPYMRSGVLWEDFRQAYGQEDPDRLVWKAPSSLMNPALTPSRLERERRLDPTRFAREYEAEFADDLAAFLPSEWVGAAVVPGRHELPPQPAVAYTAAADPSGGGSDAFTLAVVHTEGSGSTTRVVQDVMKCWHRIGAQSVNLAAAVAEIATTLKCYRLSTVTGDRYAAGWVRQEFQQAGITYRNAEMDTSQASLEAEPLFAQGRIELLDHRELVRELTLLERRPRAGGRDRVDHPPGGHDDHAAALCQAATIAASREANVPRIFFIRSPWAPWTDDDD